LSTPRLIKSLKKVSDISRNRLKPGKGKSKGKEGVRKFIKKEIMEDPPSQLLPSKGDMGRVING